MDKFNVKAEKLMKEINYHTEQKQNLKKELDEVTLYKYQYCKNVFNHDWVIEKESGMYGETFSVCKICGYEK